MSGISAIKGRYDSSGTPVLLNGMQAIARLLLEQARADARDGLRTAGYVSGYRGSPLGGLDMELARARKHLDRHNIVFQPGVNEDLAATAVWGTQQASAFPNPRYDGVFGLWYAKGPGVDRSGDALMHANAWGASRYGGVLALVGDDHGAKSSSLAHQSEGALINASIPVLHASSIADILRLGRYGYALSRASGLWVGLKVTAPVADSSALVAPQDWSFEQADGHSGEPDLHIRWPDDPLAQEARILVTKLPAARAFIGANPVDETVWAGAQDQLAIIAVGKAYNDTRAALDRLSIDALRAAQLGLRLIKLNLVWPLDIVALTARLGTARRVLIVEEKRPIVESALRAGLYQASQRPMLLGKKDEDGRPLLPEVGELDSRAVAKAVLSLTQGSASASMGITARASAQPDKTLARTPYFCAGCPHNRSTKPPPGSIAIGGIGCHAMAIHMERDTFGYTHMGGEGASWIGQAPFSSTAHVFQNLGDGTFFHSGSLAIRAAVAAGANITFKILYNHAVAMTGGQPVDGELSVEKIVEIVRAEGVARIAIVAERPHRHTRLRKRPGISVHHRDEIDVVQRELRSSAGASVLIFDKECAADVRRQRKRGLISKPAERVYINPLVCEGCGDCGVQSNCVAIAPLETDEGLKRQIDQGACNVDLSCLRGFCPSFVTYSETRKPPPARPPRDRALPAEPVEPILPTLDRPWRILVAGVGGTGVVTIGAVIAAAAAADGLGVSTYDMTGMAQKGGPVLSHVSVGREASDLHGGQIQSGQAQALIGCDPLVASQDATLDLLDPNTAQVVLAEYLAPTGAFARKAGPLAEIQALEARITATIEQSRLHRLDAHAKAKVVFGSAVAANMMLLGAAWQLGLLPVSLQAMKSAVKENGAAIDDNLAAFLLGRVWAADKDRLPDNPAAPPLAYEAFRAREVERLTSYQDKDWSDRFRDHLAPLEAVDDGEKKPFAMLAARELSRLMRYKDEYEVARLMLADAGVKGLMQGGKINFHLAPSFLPWRERGAPERPRKHRFGPWLVPVLRALAWAKRWRGSAFDVFAHQVERRQERLLIEDYVKDIACAASLITASPELAFALLSWPAEVKGFGPVKAEAMLRARAARDAAYASLHPTDHVRSAA